MDEDALRSQPRTRQLVQVILELTLVSHAPGTNYDPNTSSAKRESTVPPGGVDRKGDREESFRQKSADHFARRLDGLYAGLDKLSDARAESIRDELLSAAKAALRAWRHSPTVQGVEPERGTLQWKCEIADDPRPSRAVAGHYGVSHVTVLRYRRDYADIRTS